MAKKDTTIREALHTLNNHLATSSLSIEMLLREIDGKLNTQQKKSLKEILSANKKIATLLKEIRDLLEKE